MSSSSNANPAPQIAIAPGKRLTKNTKQSETDYGYGEAHSKSVNKIIRMLGRTIKMKVTKSTPALKKYAYNRCETLIHR